jgi:hypothetical protein
MATPVAAVIPTIDPTSVANTDSSVSLTKLGDTSTVVNKIGESSDLMSNISNDYDFLKAITEHQYAVDSVQKTLATEKATDEFSYEAELVSKVASVGVSGINTLVKMQ